MKIPVEASRYDQPADVTNALSSSVDEPVARPFCGRRFVRDRLAPFLASGTTSPTTYGRGVRQPNQPIPYSHKLHAGELGLDCRYCHVSVERTEFATVPPTQVCMNCHSERAEGLAEAQPLRESWAYGKPVPWVRVHKTRTTHFSRTAATSQAASAVWECHGRIDQMEVVRQVEPLSMGWCLECHRDPAPRLRPLDQITNMGWEPPGDKPLDVRRREFGRSWPRNSRLRHLPIAPGVTDEANTSQVAWQRARRKPTGAARTAENSPLFRESLNRELPSEVPPRFLNPLSRRSFMGILGASMALAGLSGCRRPEKKKILPYTRTPKTWRSVCRLTTPAMPLGSAVYGLLVESHEGRPTKIEGNPNHPMSLGGTNTHTRRDSGTVRSGSLGGTALGWQG